MEFKVEFNNEECCVALWRSNRRPMGVADVDRVRDELGVPRLSLDKIDSYIHCTSGPVLVVTIDEAMARRLVRYFAHQHRLKVNVPESFFNRFVKTEVFADKDKTTGEIWSAGLRDYIDVKAVLGAWLNAGAPVDWHYMTAPEEQKEAESDND